MKISKVMFGVGLLISVLCLPNLALAHAKLQNVAVVNDANNTNTPKQIRLNFSEGVEVAFSHFKLHKTHAKTTSFKNIGISADKKVVTLTLPQALSAGQYVLLWKVVSVDTHKTSGKYPLTLK